MSDLSQAIGHTERVFIAERGGNKNGARVGEDLTGRKEKGHKVLILAV
jgi:hypothetical protein